MTGELLNRLTVLVTWKPKFIFYIFLIIAKSAFSFSLFFIYFLIFFLSSEFVFVGFAYFMTGWISLNYVNWFIGIIFFYL